MKYTNVNLAQTWNPRRTGVFLALVVLLFLLAGVVQAQVGDEPGQPASSAATGASTLLSASYDFSWWTADGGGTAFATGGGYTLGGAAGQPDAGVLEGGGYTLTSGFWGGAAAQFRVYLPLVMRDWRGENWEQEPNGVAAQANGPVASNQTYYGDMPAGDANDYFYFDLATPGSVELWLTNIPGGCDYDLVLRDAALAQSGYSGNVGSADEHIAASGLPPGRYYVQVYHRSAAGSSQPYRLRAVYP